MLKNLIDGRLESPPSPDAIDVLNPANGQIIAQCPDTAPELVEEAIAAARRAQPSWAAATPLERAGYLHRIADGIRRERDFIARTISREQGKLLDLATTEVTFTADYVDYMAEWARRIEGEVVPSDRARETILLFRKPMGVIGAILPWNFPFFLFARKMAPALITGNTIVIKSSEEAPMNAELFARIVRRAGVPAGVVNLVHGRGTTVGQRISAHPDIDMITFTGSTAAGSAIMAAAARNVTKVNLELGGKAPAIIMDDCDLDLAVRAVTASRLGNAGQICNCAERIYVQSGVAAAFTDRLAEAFGKVAYGDPLGAEPVGMGPLINRKAVARVEAMVSQAVSDGAEIRVGGRADPRGGGGFFQPTVLTGCDQSMAIMRQEIFGPVAPISVFDDLDEAIGKANDCEYGLTSSIYTRSLDTFLRAQEDLRFGETYVNRENFEAIQGFHAGWRKSGIGGADGKHGVLEFTQTRVVYIQG